MLNLHARATIGKVADPLAGVLARAGVTPDALTAIGTVGVCVGALAFFPRGSFLVGTLVITAFVFSDTLDGALARRLGRSSVWGAFLDSTLDRVGDGAIFGSLALYYAGHGHSPLYAALALLSLVAGSVTSYAKARAEALGLSANVGLAERAERLIVVLGATLLTGLFGWQWLLKLALWVLAAATVWTVGQRLVEVHRQATAAAGAPSKPGSGRRRAARVRPRSGVLRSAGTRR